MIISHGLSYRHLCVPPISFYLTCTSFQITRHLCPAVACLPKIVFLSLCFEPKLRYPILTSLIYLSPEKVLAGGSEQQVWNIKKFQIIKFRVGVGRNKTDFHASSYRLWLQSHWPGSAILSLVCPCSYKIVEIRKVDRKYN